MSELDDKMQRASIFATGIAVKALAAAQLPGSIAHREFIRMSEAFLADAHGSEEAFRQLVDVQFAGLLRCFEADPLVQTDESP